MAEVETVHIVRAINCYAVTVRHDVSEVYVFAETAAKARWIAMRGYRDAGYDAGVRMDWNEVSSTRKPEYDDRYRPEFRGKYLSFEQMISGRIY